jgi:hypothetical protein
MLNRKRILRKKYWTALPPAQYPFIGGAPDIVDYFNEDGIIKYTDSFDIDQLSEEFYYSKIDAVRDNYERCMNLTSAEDLLYEEIIKFL